MFGRRSSNDFDGLFVKQTSEELEPQEVLLSRIAHEGDSSKEQEESKLETPVSRWSVSLLYLLFAFTIFGFLGKTAYLQIFVGEDMVVKAQENAIRRIPKLAERGVVYDSFFEQLVFNAPSFDVVCDKRDLPHDSYAKERLLRELALLLSTSFEDVREGFDETLSPVLLVAENLSHEQLLVAETRIQEFPGCVVQENIVREYRAGTALGHLLGYTAKISAQELQEYQNYAITDQVGKIGIEKSYESYLRGKPGELLFERDAFGNVVRELGEVEPEVGDTIVLWLDLKLQEKITVALQSSLDRVGAKKAAAVAIDPTTGGVLALISLPGFDNNLFSHGISFEDYENIINDDRNPLFNRAIAGMYPTGSTIKPLVASAALEANIIDPDTSILTEGFIEVPNQYDPEIVYRFNDWKNHGWVDMRSAIAVSSNAYFYIIGGGFGDQRGLGPTKIKQYLTQFGWGEKTNVDIPGESKGLIPDPIWKKEVKNEGWWDGDTYLLSIGQGDLLATPLQVAAAFVAIANGGTLYQPQIVQKIIKTRDALSEEEEIEIVFEPQITREGFISPENIQVVREGMRSAVRYGSAVTLNPLDVEVAAKTGTAQTGKTTYDGKDLLYTWTSAFAPYDDPEIVLTVVIEDAEEGSLVVLPVIEEVMDWYFSR